MIEDLRPLQLVRKKNLAYGWRALNLNWPISIQEAGKILVSWRQVNKSGKALKSRALTIWMEFSVVFSGQMELRFFSTKETK